MLPITDSVAAPERQCLSIQAIEAELAAPPALVDADGDAITKCHQN